MPFRVYLLDKDNNSITFAQSIVFHNITLFGQTRQCSILFCSTKLNCLWNYLQFGLEVFHKIYSSLIHVVVWVNINIVVCWMWILAQPKPCYVNYHMFKPVTYGSEVVSVAKFPITKEVWWVRIIFFI